MFRLVVLPCYDFGLTVPIQYAHAVWPYSIYRAHAVVGLDIFVVEHYRSRTTVSIINIIRLHLFSCRGSAHMPNTVLILSP